MSTFSSLKAEIECEMLKAEIECEMCNVIQCKGNV